MKNLITICIFFCIILKVNSQTRGCLLMAASGSVSDEVELSENMGNQDLDRAFHEEKFFMRQKFGLFPSFYYYSTDGSGNAFATNQVEDPNFPDGTIVLGTNLVLREAPKSFGGTTIPIILAHEMGHILDFKKGIVSTPGKEAELFADFIAGTYMYIRTSWKTTDITASLQSFHSMGDTQFGSPNHHGTPEERYDALMAGFRKAQTAHLNGSPLTLDDAITAAQEYLGL